jgi:dihydrofolate synthase/folylpolyglutamate synthase
VASDLLIVDAFELIEDMRESISLTYFEINALASLLIFRQSQLDCVLLEVGLGGRLDAVNIVDADVAVLSSIDLDHQEWLGDSRLKIGIEKIGISRPGKPFIISEENLPDGLLEAIKNTQADYLRLGKNFKYEMNSSDDQFSAYLVTQGLVDSIKSLQTNDLLPKNIVTAIQALLSAEFDLSHNLIRKAVSNLSLTGRQQKLVYRGIPVLLDVAHNPAAARVLARNISQCSGAIYAVASVLSDKDWMGIVSELNDFIDEWFIAEISDNPRAANGQQLLEMVYTSDGKGVCYASIQEAFLQAIARATSDDKVVVFGSFHTVSTVLAFIEREA